MIDGHKPGCGALTEPGDTERTEEECCTCGACAAMGDDVKSGWSLKACSERAQFARDAGTYSPIVCLEDRAQLLALVDRMRPHLSHIEGCPANRAVWREGKFHPSGDPCGCGLAALLRELDGGVKEETPSP